MRKRLACLLLGWVLALGLGSPALAKVPECEQELLGSFSLTRNGLVDEQFGPYDAGTTIRVAPVHEASASAKVDYSVFATGNYWEITHTGDSDCSLFCALQIYRLESAGGEVYRPLPDGAGYLYGRSGTFARSEEMPGETPVRMNAGDVVWFSSVNLFDFLEHAAPGERDDGSGRFLYEIAIRSASAGSSAMSATAACKFRFLLNEARTEQIKSSRFSDVAQTSYYYSAVHWALDRGITNGTTESTFSPDRTCTTAQIITFLWRFQGQPKSTLPNPFRDVEESAYYCKAAVWAYDKGLVTGTLFKGDTPCTRAATVTYLWRLRGCPASASPPRFSDVPANAPYATAVMWAVERGITNGTTQTTFSPERTCTRGQIVTFLHRYWNSMISDALDTAPGSLGKA